jgi:hypothetical protein
LTAIPSNCTVIPGEIESQLTLPASAAGRFVIAAVTATNSWTSVAGNSPVLRTSISTSRVTQTPVNTVAPVYSSSNTNFQVGSLLTVNQGTWERFPTNLSFQYLWFRCESAQALSSETIPNGCSPIELNARSNSYRVVSADIGKHVVARVTANLSPLLAGVDSSTDAFSTSQGVIVEAQAQSFNSGPVLSGTNFLRLSIQ